MAALRGRSRTLGTIGASVGIFALTALLLAGFRPGGAASSGAPLAEGARRQVVLATQRDHGLHVFDAATLQPLGRFALHNLAEQVAAQPDGGRLFLLQAATAEGNGCCALFALDLKTDRMCRLVEPVTQGPWTNGQWLFAQRGNMGVETFDAHTLARGPTIPAPGVYRLYPSSDGRWLVGLTTWAGPSLDVFDLQGMALVGRLPVAASDGAWIGQRFVLYGQESGQARLWTVSPDAADLGPPATLALPAGAVEPLALSASAERLFLYEPRGWWFKGGDPTGQQASGGVFVVEPARGTVLAHLAPALDLAQLVASPDGQRLYALDAGEPRRVRPPRLLLLDPASGVFRAERLLAPDVWSITLAALPEALLPRGEVQPQPCDRTEPTPGPRALPPPTATPHL